MYLCDYKCGLARCDNLIPGMTTSCRRGAESGEPTYVATFGEVPACTYMSYRPYEPFGPTAGGNTSDQTPEQR
jgi:hypothetical protein